MKYMLLIYDEEANFASMSEKDMHALMADYGKFSTEVKEAGVHISSHRLRPITTATTVKNRAGETLMTDGPFAETKEQLGGYYLIDVKDLDEALKWAAKIPSAWIGSI